MRHADSPGGVADADGVEGGLSVVVLGELTARMGGRAVNLGGRRQRAVLALLVLARGDVVPADRMVDNLWGGQAPPSSVGALQAYVSHLRRQLEPGRTARSRGTVIVSEGPGYALRVGREAVDAWRFERLVQHSSTLGEPARAVTALSEALALWRGPAFVDYAGTPWADAEASRLAELRAVARERLLAARLDCGENAVLVPEVEALIADAPLREERWRLLVLALYRAQRQGDALAALRRARAVLAAELGVDPGPALRQLETDVLAHSPALQGPPAPAGPAGPNATAAMPAPVARPAPRADDDLVERVREIAELRACVDEAVEGQARLVLVEGPAGIGKTRLLAETRRLAAERGVATLGARGSQLEKEYGFGMVRQLFEPVIADPARRAGLLTGAAVSAVTVFDVAGEQAQPQADGSLAALHGLYWLTVNLSAERPLVLAIDDLQWCDSGSLRFLAYLVGRIQGLPILIVATLRTGEPHDNEALLAELTHDPAAVQIRPSPLTADGTAHLVRRRLGEASQDGFVVACHRTTSGNPLLLRQLLRALQSEGVRPEASHADTVTAIGSRAVSSLVLRGLARMPPANTATARAVAVLGSGAALPAVAALAELPEGEAVTAIAALSRAEVLRDDYPLSFVHPLVADAVYRDLPPGERQLHHERAARVLHDAGAPAEQVAAHLLHVPQRGDPWTVRVLRSAAATAANRGAAEAAAAYLGRALAEPPESAERSAVMLELGRAQTLVDGTAALPVLRAAFEAQTDPKARVAAAQMVARTLIFAGGRGEATTFARRAAIDLPAELVDERQGLLALERIGGYMHGLDPKLWSHADQPDVVGAGPGARMLAAALALETAVAGQDRAKAVTQASFALADRSLFDVDTGLLWVVAANVLDLADEPADAIWDEALAHAHLRGSVFAASSVHLWRGHLSWRRGELREARQLLAASAEQLTQWGSGVGPGRSDAYLVGVLVDLDDLPGAEAVLQRRLGHHRTPADAGHLAEAQTTLLLALGRYDEALVALGTTSAPPPQAANPAWWRHRALRAQALHGLGRTDPAIELAEAELAAARQWGAPSMVGRGLRLLGELRGADGTAHLREAVAVLSTSLARLEYARALHALGNAVPPAEGIPLLQDAHRTAQQCGAEGLCRAVAEDLEAAGAQVQHALTASTTLTPTEHRIAAMCAAGGSDREIAQSLFLTPTAVATTLADVHRRLATRTATELRAALAMR